MKIKKIYKFLSLIISTIAFILFSLSWWKRKSISYNEAGRYFDGIVVWHEQDIVVYALFSIISFVAAVAMAYLVCRKSNVGT